MSNGRKTIHALVSGIRVSNLSMNLRHSIFMCDIWPYQQRRRITLASMPANSLPSDNAFVRKASVLAIAAFVWISFATDAVAQEAPEVLRKLRASINATEQLSLSVTSDVSSINDVEAHGMVPGRRFSEVIRCEDRDKVSTYFIEKNNSELNKYKMEYVINAKGAVLGAQALFDAEGIQQSSDNSGANLSILLSDKQLVEDAVQLRDRLAVYNALIEGSVAVWVVGHSPLLNYLQEGDPRLSLSRDGATVSATGRLGRVELQLSRENGWLPRAFVIEKQADSLIGGVSVRSLYSPAPLPSGVVIPQGAVPDMPKVEASSMTWRGDVSKFDQTEDGIWYPSELTLVCKTHFESGKVNTATSQVKIEPIAVTEATSCDFTIKIPKGYTVFVEGAPHLPYRWNGMQAVPGVPDFPKVEAYEAANVPVRSSNRTLLILVNVVIIGVLLLAIILRKRASR